MLLVIYSSANRISIAAHCALVAVPCGSMHPDSVSISHRLGHSQVSTTANIYAHVMEEADKRNADVLADVFLKKA